MSLNPVYILYPVCALVLLTFLVLLVIPLRRFRAGFAGKVKAEDFRYGESANVPPDVSIPNRNYMNLLEAPTLFYVACIVAFVAQVVTPGMISLAWAYVGLRVVHSLIHLSYNRVRHRLAFFAASNVVLAVLWVRIAAAL
ncbi:MAG TPA: MAPEG family protein [Usitatibacter sp.]|nr:MAPEG family protein [Usitatibacter sp.]